MIAARGGTALPSTRETGKARIGGENGIWMRAHLETVRLVARERPDSATYENRLSSAVRCGVVEATQVRKLKGEN